MPFRRRLALFMVVTLVGLLVVAGALGYSAVKRTIEQQGNRELAEATGVFVRQLNVLSERVSAGVEILALDFGLRQAIARHDRDTSLSALRNLSRRISASRMMLVGLDGIVVADTVRTSQEGKAFPFPGLIADATANREGTALANLDGAVYWIVVVPVKAPLPIGYIAAGVPLDNTLLTKLSQLSSLNTSIALVTTDGNNRWRVAVASAGFNAVARLPESTHGVGGVYPVTGPNGETYLTRAAPLATAEDSRPVRAVIAYPLDTALEPYRALLIPILLVLAVALAVSLGGAMVIARSVSRPIEGLASAARRIAEGDYRSVDMPSRRDEIGDLANALNAMIVAVAERETALTGAVSHLELARNEAVRADSAKSQFLANMSHELRTPLNAIIGFAEMLGRQMLGPLGNARYNEYATDIEASGRHLLAIVERMLDLSKSEAGQLAIAHERIQPGVLLMRSVAMLAPIAQRGGVEVAIEGEPKAWPELRGDPVRLKQAFVNLIHNAIKFTPARGRVTVSGTADNNSLFIRIADTGIGIDPQAIHLVLKPFHRLTPAFDGRYQGSGLGLPYAKAVVDLHGGTLDLESTLHEGTVVTLALPLDGAGRIHREAA